jgi:hypothetical protein
MSVPAEPGGISPCPANSSAAASRGPISPARTSALQRSTSVSMSTCTMFSAVTPTGTTRALRMASLALGIFKTLRTTNSAVAPTTTASAALRRPRRNSIGPRKMAATISSGWRIIRSIGLLDPRCARMKNSIGTSTSNGTSSGSHSSGELRTFGCSSRGSAAGARPVAASTARATASRHSATRNSHVAGQANQPSIGEISARRATPFSS